ncbi:MAG: Sugar efflux transporter A [Candidatus Erwinia impunctatus]|nr:Sugar efflux transporter A [Culicoides impunctatus]
MTRSSLCSRMLHPVLLSFLAVAFMAGIAGALQAPTLSLFLTREVGVTPFWVGCFFTVNALAGIIVSFLLAKRSDLRGDRRMLIVFCCVMALINAVIFAFSRNYLVLITLGVLFSALASVGVPQIFALAREYADRSVREVVMFSSVMRAQLSLAWVIGPPLSFALALNYGFTVMFLVAGALFLGCLILVYFTLPSVPRETLASGTLPASVWRQRDVPRLFIASLCMWTCNTMYIIDMPIYITEVLGMEARLAGWLMGLAAGLEIPAMILAGWVVKFIGKRRMMLIAVAAGVVFYLGLVLFDSRPALITLQIFNAVFIGIIAGIGMLYFQDLLPGRAGAATTLFTNSISTGIIVAGVLQGLVVEYFGHAAVYQVALCLTVVAWGLLATVKDP